MQRIIALAQYEARRIAQMPEYMTADCADERVCILLLGLVRSRLSETSVPTAFRIKHGAVPMPYGLLNPSWRIDDAPCYAFIRQALMNEIVSTLFLALHVR